MSRFSPVSPPDQWHAVFDEDFDPPPTPRSTNPFLDPEAADEDPLASIPTTFPSLSPTRIMSTPLPAEPSDRTKRLLRREQQRARATLTSKPISTTFRSRAAPTNVRGGEGEAQAAQPTSTFALASSREVPTSLGGTAAAPLDRLAPASSRAPTGPAISGTVGSQRVVDASRSVSHPSWPSVLASDELRAPAIAASRSAAYAHLLSLIHI